jgi:hypothetical protein
LQVTGRCREISVSKPFTDRNSRVCRGMPGLSLPFVHLLRRERNQKVAPLDTLFVVDEPLASRRPGIRLTDLAAKQERQPEPESTAGRTRTCPRLDEDAMEAFEDALKLEVAAWKWSMILNVVVNATGAAHGATTTMLFSVPTRRQRSRQTISSGCRQPRT